MFFACVVTKNKTDKESEKNEYVGVIAKNTLLKEPYKKWFKESYEAF